MNELPIIWRYLIGKLHRKEEQQIRNRIVKDNDFAEKVIKVKSLLKSVNRTINEIKADFISEYIHDGLTKDEETKVEELLRETGDLEFYKSMKSPRVYVNDKGELVYYGEDDELISVVANLNIIEINGDLLELTEDIEEAVWKSEESEEEPVFEDGETVLRGGTPACKILYPSNHAVLGTTKVEFILECENPEDLKGFSIEIYNNDEDCVRDITIDEEKIGVDLSFFSVGHYFVKLISPKKELIDTKVFHIVYTKT